MDDTRKRGRGLLYKREGLVCKGEGLVCKGDGLLCKGRGLCAGVNVQGEGPVCNVQGREGVNV